jgi:hypothetical protein
MTVELKKTQQGKKFLWSVRKTHVRNNWTVSVRHVAAETTAKDGKPITQLEFVTRSEGFPSFAVVSAATCLTETVQLFLTCVFLTDQRNFLPSWFLFYWVQLSHPRSFLLTILAGNKLRFQRHQPLCPNPYLCWKQIYSNNLKMKAKSPDSRSSLFWDVTQRRLVVIMVLKQPISSIFKGRIGCPETLLSTVRNTPEERRSRNQLSVIHLQWTKSKDISDTVQLMVFVATMVLLTFIKSLLVKAPSGALQLAESCSRKWAKHRFLSLELRWGKMPNVTSESGRNTYGFKTGIARRICEEVMHLISDNPTVFHSITH